MLWVCDKCFKYMAEGLSWELHVVRIFHSSFVFVVSCYGLVLLSMRAILCR